MEIAAASFPGIYLMGMCSRQERIQKDIDVVIQKSRAEKDCLFAGEFSPFRRLRPRASFPCPPAAPLPSFLTATCVARAGGGLHVPVPGFIWQQLLQREREPKGGGGASLSPTPLPPSPLPPPPQSGAATSSGGRTTVARAGV